MKVTCFDCINWKYKFRNIFEPEKSTGICKIKNPPSHMSTEQGSKPFNRDTIASTTCIKAKHWRK